VRDNHAPSFLDEIDNKWSGEPDRFELVLEACFFRVPYQGVSADCDYGYLTFRFHPFRPF